MVRLHGRARKHTAIYEGDSMKFKIRAVVAGIAGLALTTGLGLGATVPAASASSVPVVYMSNFFRFPHVQPHGETETFATATNELYLTASRWSHWSGTSAHATSGNLVWRSCWGSCFRMKSAPSSQTVYAPQSHGGHRFFTKLRFVYKYHGTHVVTATYTRTGGWTTPRSWRPPVS